MQTFSYSAVKDDNTYVAGKIQARSQKKAIQDLEKDGLLVINIKKEPLYNLGKIVIFSSISRMDMIHFTRHLNSFLEAGIVLDQALKIAAEKTNNKKFKEILMDVYNKIIGGQKLHLALSAHKKCFSNYFINLVKVGEESGKLDEILKHLLDQQENDYELITKTRSAMIYPVIILFVAGGVVIMMLTYVVPTIAGTLLEYGGQLPLMTRILIGLSGFLVKFGVVVLMIVVALIVLLRNIIKTAKGKWYWESFLFSMPIVGKIVKEFNIARFTRSMSAPLLSGLSIDKSLQLALDTSNNSHYRESIVNSVKFVRKGIPLTDVLHGYPDLYPPDVIRMLEIGEKTGKFDQMFTKLAYFYEKAVFNTFSNLATIIEPALIVTVGITVGFIAVSILLPIWNFSETI